MRLSFMQAMPGAPEHACYQQARSMEQQVFRLTQQWQGAGLLSVERVRGSFGPNHMWQRALVVVHLPRRARGDLVSAIRTTGHVQLPNGQYDSIKVDGQSVVQIKTTGWPVEYQPERVTAALRQADPPVQVLHVEPVLSPYSPMRVAGEWLVTAILPKRGLDECSSAQQFQLRSHPPCSGVQQQQQQVVVTAHPQRQLA